MASVTLSIPDEIKSEMKRFPWVNWSQVAREILEKKLETLELLTRAESVEEKEFAEWAAKVVKKGRKGRFDELKSKGLV